MASATLFRSLMTMPKLRLLVMSRSEEHTSELQSRVDLVCRLLLEKKKELHRLYHELGQAHHAAAGDIPAPVLDALCDDINNPLEYSAMQLLEAHAMSEQRNAAAAH